MGLLGAALLLAGCSQSVPEGAYVLTQSPVTADAPAAGSVLDERYPVGSRVALLLPPYQTNHVRVLSRGLVAAGSPVVAPDGRTICFAGKADATASWQIYQADLGGGQPRRLTAVAGGAMDPAVAAGSELVFASPVPAAGRTWTTDQPAALYAQAPGQPPQRLTFSPRSAVEPTVLRDGRILFVTAQPGEPAGPPPRLALFTVNRDGTEITAFAGQHDDGAPVIHRPRELPGGRVGFLAGNATSAPNEFRAESIRTAQPHHSRALLPGPGEACRSLEPGEDAEWLASVPGAGGSFAIHRLTDTASLPGTLVFDDPAWHDFEAARVAARAEPQGHISAMSATKTAGTILCLDVNETSHRAGAATNRAARVRMLAASREGAKPLGELSPHADGSFMAEAPVDVPLVIEALDDTGTVVRRCPPLLWVRAGENRACIGCHEPHHRSPKNVRPLAANHPPVVLTPPPLKLARTNP